MVVMPSPKVATAQGLRLLLLATCAILLTACAGAPPQPEVKAVAVAIPGIDPRLLEKIEARYGKDARKRVEDWRWMIEGLKGQAEPAKLAGVNDFINRLEFVDDSVHWGVADYWATPIETLATNGGDCEDLVIAKYFTLIELGVPDERLRLTYVQSQTLNKAHMVLDYQEHPGADPLVLDNVATAIMPAWLRTDLVPVYSFNGSGLWLAKQRNEGEPVENEQQARDKQEVEDEQQVTDERWVRDEQWVGDAQRVSLWKGLLERMRGGELR